MNKEFKIKTWLDLEAISQSSERCSICKNMLNFDVTGKRKVSNGHICDDCFFRLVKEHPIVSSRNLK